MKNDLFNQGLFKKYGRNFKLTPSKLDQIKDYLSKLDSGVFKSETKNYLYFYDTILKGLLGYQGENVLFDEKQDEGTGKSEFVLTSDDKKFMIIELKGQGIDLDKKQSGRSDNKSPVEQAFGYALNTGDVEWILVSNYNEFRLYNYYEKTKYISFNANELLDKEIFSYFILAFSKESHLESDYINKVHDGTLLVDKKLANEFYKLYNETRLMLIKELETTSNCERLDAIHYAQLILNRYMFVCFAEDTGLLPSQISVDTISTPILKGNVRHRNIWQRLNELFIYINEGNEYKRIAEYNGGLFQEDIDFLNIRDMVDDQSIFHDTYQNWKFEVYEKDIEHLLGKVGNRVNPIYRNMLTISSFDFSTELDVNILGHIFENSIGDIEELKEDTKGRRKKEGIYYTPDYITDYICRNTIIPYLSKSGKIDNVTDLIEEYSWSTEIEDLDEKLKNIKIVDPACGSGAFLNKATDILLEIHEAIFDIKKGYTTTTQMKVGKGKRRRTESIQHTDLGAYVFDHIEKRREILLNNIYGVDLNEESVEITKLSLFLKVCRKDLKLPNLDQNIKCGNSLINDPEFTHNPFKWRKEFHEIFKDGGFNLVIGNPPYVRMEKIKEVKPYLKKKYLTFNGRADLYVYFFERGLNILKKGGFIGFISSNKFIKTDYGKNLRELMIKDSIFYKYVNHTYDSIFADVTTYPSVFIFKKVSPDINSKILVDNNFEVEQSRFNSDPWSFERPEVLNLRDKIDKNGVKIKNIPNFNIQYGIKTGYNEAFIINKKLRDQLIKVDPKNKEIIKPLINGKDVKRYSITFKDSFVIISKHNFHNELKKYPAILNHLKKYEPQLKNRGQVRNGQHHWLELDNTPNDNYLAEFKKDKLIYPEMAQNLFAVYDNKGFYTNKTCFIIRTDTINLKFLSVLLSSKPLNFLFKFIGSPLQGNFFNLSKTFVENLPIIFTTPEEEEPIIELADKILKLNQDLQNEFKGFNHWIQKEFSIEKLSQKLEKYYELSEDEFIDELKKKKIDTKSRKNREYLEQEFNESLAIINPLLQEIEQTDKEIDQMVYELYGLTEDEIKIIEESLT